MQLIEDLKKQSINDFHSHLFNRLMEKLILTHQRNQKGVVKSIVEHIVKDHRIKLTYYNQLEALLQIYLMNDEEEFIEFVQKLDYTLDANAFNLVLNLVLDAKNYNTAIRMFELVFEQKVKCLDLSQVDVPKHHLKTLLFIQTKKLKEEPLQLEHMFIDENDEKHKTRVQKLHEKWFGDLKDVDAHKFFTLNQEESE